MNSFGISQALKKQSCFWRCGVPMAAFPEVILPTSRLNGRAVSRRNSIPDCQYSFLRH
jgi:hypothetical protein